MGRPHVKLLTEGTTVKSPEDQGSEVCEGWQGSARTLLMAPWFHWGCQGRPNSGFGLADFKARHLFKSLHRAPQMGQQRVTSSQRHSGCSFCG